MKKESLSIIFVKTLLAVLLFAGIGTIIIGGGYIIGEYYKNEGNNQIVKPVDQEKNYYNVLEKKCDNDKCCLASLKRMRANNHKKADENGNCPEGFFMNGLKCKTSYQWCEPIEKCQTDSDCKFTCGCGAISKDEICDDDGIIWDCVDHYVSCESGKCVLGEEKLQEADQPDTSNWQTYRNEEFGFEVKYPENLILNHYNEESLSKVCYGCWRKVVILQDKEKNYNIRLSVYTSDRYNLCKTQLYNERDLNKIGNGEYKIISMKDRLFLFNKNIELENIFKDDDLNSIQSQCQRIGNLVVAVNLSASNLDDFVLRNSDYVIQQANQILSSFKFIEN